MTRTIQVTAYPQLAFLSAIVDNPSVGQSLYEFITLSRSQPISQSVRNRLGDCWCTTPDTVYNTHSLVSWQRCAECGWVVRWGRQSVGHCSLSAGSQTAACCTCGVMGRLERRGLAQPGHADPQPRQVRCPGRHPQRFLWAVLLFTVSVCVCVCVWVREREREREREILLYWYFKDALVDVFICHWGSCTPISDLQ